MEYHYKLHVKNVSRGLDTEAEVVQTIRGELVREEQFSGGKKQVRLRSTTVQLLYRHF